MRLSTDDEARLLATILLGLWSATPTNRVAADTIISDLIDIGYVDAYRAPAMQEAWQDGEDFATLLDVYMNAPTS